MAIGCGKALDDLEKKLGNLKPGEGAGARCSVPLPPTALRQLERDPGPENALMPDPILPLFMWRVSGARRWGSRGMASLIERDASAFSVLPVIVLNTQLSLSRSS